MESVNESFEYAMHEVVYVYLIKRGKKLLPLYEAKKEKIAALCYDKILHVM